MQKEFNDAIKITEALTQVALENVLQNEAYKNPLDKLKLIEGAFAAIVTDKTLDGNSGIIKNNKNLNVQQLKNIKLLKTVYIERIKSITDDMLLDEKDKPNDLFKYLEKIKNSRDAFVDFQLTRYVFFKTMQTTSRQIINSLLTDRGVGTEKDETLSKQFNKCNM